MALDSNHQPDSHNVFERFTTWNLTITSNISHKLQAQAGSGGFEPVIRTLIRELTTTMFESTAFSQPGLFKDRSLKLKIRSPDLGGVQAGQFFRSYDFKGLTSYFGVESNHSAFSNALDSTRPNSEFGIFTGLYSLLLKTSSTVQILEPNNLILVLYLPELTPTSRGNELSKTELARSPAIPTVQRAGHTGKAKRMKCGEGRVGVDLHSTWRRRRLSQNSESGKVVDITGQSVVVLRCQARTIHDQFVNYPSLMTENKWLGAQAEKNPGQVKASRTPFGPSTQLEMLGENIEDWSTISLSWTTELEGLNLATDEVLLKQNRLSGSASGLVNKTIRETDCKNDHAHYVPAAVGGLREIFKYSTEDLDGESLG
ncbi:hypothetical protein R3P38DRAFT_2794087 [Favolaschia claudopus]|uniref:Uncharacterized protein n=1 Tax=Favolaschia claudopus TaxID=2862362 RepID=A0AAW0AC03_9AGAR